MSNYQKYKTEVITFQKEILDDLKPYIVNNDSFLKSTNWFVPSNNMFVYSKNQRLYIVAEEAKRNYISYLEKNASFGYLPEEDLKVLPNEIYNIFIDGETIGDFRVELFIIEYSSKEKIKTHILSINTQVEIITTKETNSLRIALRISGNGLGSIKNIEMKRKKGSYKYREFVQGTKVNTPPMPKKISDVKMACIFDEFTTTCFQEEVELITFTPDNWEETLQDKAPHLLMVESAWKGNSGSWEYKIAKYNNADKTSLTNLIKWCNSRGIPTVFWNKEDPIHYNNFLDTAKLFDFIFTTDANMINDYQEAVGHKNVFALPFSAQPRLHNPIKIVDSRIHKISFAGSYYANRHEDRKKDMENMLELAATQGLDIYDRNFDKNKTLEKSEFRFPERFRENVKGSLKYDEIEKAYKEYKVMLNVNSVKNSPTMFSRRVFEGLASGTPILSSYSEGIKKIFDDIVLISENTEELKENLDKLMNDEQFYYEKSLEGIREVYLNHTYKHRIKHILDKVGINVNYSLPMVTVVAIAKSLQEFNFILNQFNSQTWKKKKLIVLLDNFQGYIEIMNNYNSGNVYTYVLSYMSNYERIEQFINSEYVAFFDPKDYYSENYLTDMMIATQYSRADIIGKGNRFVFKDNLYEKNPGIEYEYVSDLSISSSVVNQKVFKGYDVEYIFNKLKKASGLNEFFKRGYQLFSINKFNYVKSGRLMESKLKRKIQL